MSRDGCTHGWSGALSIIIQFGEARRGRRPGGVTEPMLSRGLRFILAAMSDGHNYNFYSPYGAPNSGGHPGPGGYSQQYPQEYGQSDAGDGAFAGWNEGMGTAQAYHYPPIAGTAYPQHGVPDYGHHQPVANHVGQPQLPQPGHRQSRYSSLAGAMGPTPPSIPSTSSPQGPPTGSQTHAKEIALAPADPGDYPFNASTSASKVCTRCGTRTTPLWRRHPQTDKPVCNACGLYFINKQRDRPADRWEPPAPSMSGAGPVCANCGTTVASAWRRDKKGAQVCNACGVYERARGVPRPVDFRTDVVKTRPKD
ncbi:GATA zinc finger domain-containing protein [Mycena indigotica]|uniref:GATA zinc finger domain-containing protein n=1 Tax=Mycena indigotica TaxID=2126181 RepID=A0A8H6VYD3_9AGAR|nr:GATA zinc finger domain-containing protein [Mycena indigotica]KAF7292689.1 GATA zinc finger domain-containing protein [Mycena indigotica]